MNLFRRPKSVIRHNIDPDEIFLDSKNLPEFNTDQFEGRLEKSISIGTIALLSGVFALMVIILFGKAWYLQINDGDRYALMSNNNTQKETAIFALRGSIYDRNGIKLAWNSINPENMDFSSRAYAESPAFSHVLGYVKYPAKDKSGVYFRTNFEGVAGIEKQYNTELEGQHGLKIVEKDAVGKVTSESVIRPSQDGKNLNLSLDSKVNEKLYDEIEALAKKVGFTGGSGIIMDVHTGEVISLASYPAYSSQIMSDGSDRETISKYLTDKNKPFLDRAITGLYTPGSIVKPYVAIGALEEKVISPEKEILSTGSISIPNPYDPTRASVFMDWRPQGLVDMRHALAVSSDVYFYEVGGGFQDQKGLGIDRLNKYFSMFGFGRNTETGFFSGPAGTIPSPTWKAKVFPGDPWRVGDTYFTSIGQYGFQVTSVQMIKALATIANDGTFIHPSIFKVSTSTPVIGETIPVDKEDFKIVREGMRLGATMGTAVGLNVPYIKIAAKTGTAELGVSKAFVNSWVTGFFPYENPKYAFVVMMERGPRANIYGATYVMRGLFDWLYQTDSEYLK